MFFLYKCILEVLYIISTFPIKFHVLSLQMYFRSSIHNFNFPHQVLLPIIITVHFILIQTLRPIALTNELYKIIICIMVNRLKIIIAKIVRQMQSAFILGRSITDNILFAQDLIHHFHLNQGTPRMCITLDLAKTYNSVEWDFLEVALRCPRFPDRVIKILMECVSGAQFSVLVIG